MPRAKYKQLSKDDRVRIEALSRAGHKPREIAELIGFHVSTIYRELRRGEYMHLTTEYTYERRYSAEKAEADRELRATAKGAPLKIGCNYAVAEFIEEKIGKDHYSPAAVCALLRSEKCAGFGITFCRATIYKYIEDGNIFPGITNKDLPERGERKRKYDKVREKKAPLRGRSIDTRPEEVNSRAEPGHWEMDSILGTKGSKSRLLVLSERATRLEIIMKLPNGKASSVVRALNRLERQYGESFSETFLSITCDNGSEFSDWEALDQSCLKGKERRTTIYFCHPYTACERGTNENINRMIRRRFPKGTNFDKVKASQVREVEHWVNTYPRGILGYISAEDAFRAAFNRAS